MKNSSFTENETETERETEQYQHQYAHNFISYVTNKNLNALSGNGNGNVIGNVNTNTNNLRNIFDNSIYLGETVLDEAMMVLLTPEYHSIHDKLHALVSISILQGTYCVVYM